MNGIGAAASPAATPGAGGNFAALRAVCRELPGICKFRIGVFMTLTALAAMIATAGVAIPAVHPAPLDAFFLVLATMLAAGGAGGFNQFHEADLDRRMPRTCQRPFAAGRLRRSPWWLALFLAMVAAGTAIAAAFLNAAVALHLFLGAFVYAVVYTIWLKRRTWLNIVIGGASGSFAVLAGAAVVEPVPGPVAAWLALALFLWTPSHFWSLAIARNGDYVRSCVPMLPVIVGNERATRIVLVNTLALVAVSVMPFFHGLGPVYLVCALVGGVIFLFYNLEMLLRPSAGAAMRSFFASLLQLVLLVVGAVAGGLALA